MAGYYKLKQSEKNQEWYFGLYAGNHEQILRSEGYKAKASAEAGITSVQKNSVSDARYESKSSDKGNFWFVLKATNGQVIGQSEMYASAAACQKGIESVKANGPATMVKEE